MTGIDRVLSGAARRVVRLGKALLAPWTFRALCFPQFSVARIENREEQTATGTPWSTPVWSEAAQSPRMHVRISGDGPRWV